ncbi:BTB/POZ domain-containing protein 6-like [Haliotis rufescens]|uniref:BTB/POZ domain-containing protein 6-like n=1 Tax=Haliotis rufescens TaxID=6454 RepID=UPI00201F6098|nr:BTB/POZ domain-containing protein 6-like [Haliotis rufescens]
MYTSRKYSLDALYDLCVTSLEEFLSEDNVCQILEECHGYGELDLEQRALKILTRGGNRVAKSLGFVSLCRDCLDQFVRSDNLRLKEEDVFDAVLSWTKRRCRKEGVSDTPENIRRVLGEMRYEIRFTSIPLEYLVKVVGKSGLLTGDERIRIMDRDMDTTVDISPFKHSQRKVDAIIEGKYKASKKRVANRFIQCGPILPAGKSAISFSPSQSILLLGCQLFGGWNGDAEYTVTIRVFDANNAVIDESFLNTRMLLQGSKVLNDFLFHSPLYLTAGATYTLYVNMKGPGTTFGAGGSATVTVDGIEFTFTDSPMSTTDTSRHEGQIPGLIFSRPSKGVCPVCLAAAMW